MCVCSLNVLGESVCVPVCRCVIKGALLSLADRVTCPLACGGGISAPVMQAGDRQVNLGGLEQQLCCAVSSPHCQTQPEGFED